MARSRYLSRQLILQYLLVLSSVVHLYTFSWWWVRTPPQRQPPPTTTDLSEFKRAIGYVWEGWPSADSSTKPRVPLLSCRPEAPCPFDFMRVEVPSMKITLVSKRSTRVHTVVVDNSEGLKIGGSISGSRTELVVLSGVATESVCDEIRDERLVVQELQVDDALLGLFGHFWIDYLPSFFPLMLSHSFERLKSSLWYRHWAVASYTPRGFAVEWLAVLGRVVHLPKTCSRCTVCFRSFGIGNDRALSIARTARPLGPTDARLVLWRQLSAHVKTVQGSVAEPITLQQSASTAGKLEVSITLFDRSAKLSTSKRRLINKDQLFTAARKAADKWSVVQVLRPEELSTRGVVQMLSSTSIFIAAHGSGQANMFFLRPNAHAVELQPPRFWEVNHEWMMPTVAALLGLEFYQWPSALHQAYTDEQVRRQLEPDIFMPRNYIQQRRYFLDNDIWFHPHRFEQLVRHQLITFRMRAAGTTLLHAP